MSGTATTTRRAKQRQATLAEIITVSRELLRGPDGISLRAVAQKMGITAPALYRYVDNVQDLYELVAHDIDDETAALLEAARDSQPADDPAAQITVVAFAFRRWALANRAEFGLMFANPLTGHPDPEELHDQKIGMVFTDLLMRLWERYDFPVPTVEEIDPAVVATLAQPMIPAKVELIPPDAIGLLWVFMRSWVALYGTVTLEVFRHCDPRVIGSGALFRAMLVEQAEKLGFADEIPRLLPLIERELAATLT